MEHIKVTFIEVVAKIVDAQIKRNEKFEMLFK